MPPVRGPLSTAYRVHRFAMYSTIVERVFSLIFPSSLQSPSAEVTAGGASQIPTAKIVKAKRSKELRFPRAGVQDPCRCNRQGQAFSRGDISAGPYRKEEKSVEVFSCKEELFLYHGRKAMP